MGKEETLAGLKAGIKKVNNKTPETEGNKTLSFKKTVKKQEEEIQVKPVEKVDTVNIKEEENSLVTTSYTLGKTDLANLRKNCKSNDEKPAQVIRRLLRDAGYFE